MKQKGFTLPELLVTGAIIGLMLGVVVLMGRPEDYSKQKVEAARWLAVAELTQALNAFAEDHGTLPANIPRELTEIGIGQGVTGMVDLCSALVPKYLKDLVVDPEENFVLTDTNCRQQSAVYTTGMFVSKTAGNKLIVSSPKGEISLTKQF